MIMILIHINNNDNNHDNNNDTSNRGNDTPGGPCPAGPGAPAAGPRRSPDISLYMK